MPSSALAAITHSQLGAHITINGTGNPNSQPTTHKRLRPQTSATRPDTRLASALMTPKLTMKETTNVVEAILNSSEPISGTTVRSRPTMPPTKALIRTSRENCGQLARRPRLTLGTPSAADIRGHEARIERPDLRCLRRSRRNVRQHRPQKGWLVLYPES